ncbi:unnamed protein product [Prorocentrum cordatum]|uniref:Dynamin GTPase domain-containing protein n=1 Tax=Prorocentrum cordatum TaxID=2364126 RepID=A0ABN9XDW3_9DINO|nr:unnamed protein product [Polarella glacialis]
MAEFRQGVVDLPHESNRLNANMQQLEDLVAMFDTVQPVVAKVLDGWTPPHIIVVGLENSGKSTLLERLLKLPVFPRSPDVCTRMPIRVRVRRGGSQVAVFLSVVKRGTGEKIKGPIRLALGSSEDGVRRMMDEFADVAGIELEVTVTSPVLPPVNMIDLPGLVLHPPDDRKRTGALVLEYIRHYKANSVFLLVGPAYIPPNQSVAFAMVKYEDIEDRCIGVLTMVDMLNEISPALSARFGGTDAATLTPHGFIGTANPPTELLPGESPMVRLCHQEKNERAQLEKIGLRGHGVSEILKTIRDLYRQSMVRDVVPKTIACLLDQRQALKVKHAELGLPVASGELTDAAIQFLSTTVRDRLFVLSDRFHEEAKRLQSAQTELLQQNLMERMQELSSATGDQFGASALLLSLCEKSVDHLSNLLDTCLDDLLRDNELPVRLQRFPDVLSEMKQKLKITVESSDELPRYIDSFHSGVFPLCSGSNVSPFSLLSREGLTLLAKHLAHLTHGSPLPTAHSRGNDVSEVVRRELLEETCYAHRSDLDEQLAQLTDAMRAMMKVSLVSVDDMCSAVGFDTFEQKVSDDYHLEKRRVSSTWIDHFRTNAFYAEVINTEWAWYCTLELPCRHDKTYRVEEGQGRHFLKYVEGQSADGQRADQQEKRRARDEEYLDREKQLRRQASVDHAWKNLARTSFDEHERRGKEKGAPGPVRGSGPAASSSGYSRKQVEWEERLERHRQKSVETLDEQPFPFVTEITLIEQAIGFCKSLAASREVGKGEEAKDIEHKNMAGLQVLRKKDDRDEFWFEPTKAKKSKGSKPKGKEGTAKLIKYHAVTFKLFNQLKLNAPITLDDIPPTLEKLEAELVKYEHLAARFPEQ